MLKARKSNLPKISVVIPVYNTVDYIEETLQSLVDQQYPLFEIVIQDGGSTDGSVDVIKKFAKKYPKRIIWESKKDSGQCDAINKGLKKTTGEILTYINADDIYFENAFNSISEYYLKDPNCLWLAGRGVVINKRSEEVSSLFTKLWVNNYKNTLLRLNKYTLLLTVNYLMQPSVFITREAYVRYGDLKGTKNYVLEYEYWLRLGKVKMPVVINSLLTGFRMSGENISSVQHKELLEDDDKIVKSFTQNPLILFLHKLNYWGRLLSLRLL